MENNNINLLDLGDDILIIIGGYVKKDNIDRMEKEEDFKYADEGTEYLKKNNQFSEENIMKWSMIDCLNVVIQEMILKNIEKLEISINIFIIWLIYIFI